MECVLPLPYVGDMLIKMHIISGDVARVNGQLAVSRAFGDKNLKSHLRSDPDVKNIDVDGNTDLLILASDGLWKVSFCSNIQFGPFSFLHSVQCTSPFSFL